MNKFIRLFAFLAAFLLVLVLANTFLIQMDSVTAITMHDMKARSDIELAVVGSSIAQYHFNPEIVTEQTGLKTFSVSFNNISLQGAIAVTRELLLTNSPQWIVLTLDHYNLHTVKEDANAEYRVMPHLTSLRTKIDYYLSTCREDGAYIDRLFLFREFGVASLADVAKNIALRYAPETVFSRIEQTLPPGLSYMGDGYLRSMADTTPEVAVRTQAIGYKTPGYDYSLFAATKRMLLEYRALCESSGANLMIVVPPNLTANMLYQAEALPYTESLMRFCEENDIPCFNFAYAKPELLERLDPYFFDLYHFNGEGSDLFSQAFTRVFNLYLAGEETDSLFYADADAYLETIDFITNVWLKPGEEPNSFVADCNRGPQVVPEYAFAMIDGDGVRTMLRDYGDDPAFSFDLPKGCELRVLARKKGEAGDDAIYFDYPSDYDVFLGK